MDEVTERTLPGGARLFVAANHAAPVAAIYVWLAAGARDESPGEHGAAHFLEHMLFKGTARRGVGESAAAVEELGGDLNAFTSHDHTAVHATVEASGAGAALREIVDMVRHCAIDPGELEREREVILDEIRRYDDDPETVLDEAVQAALYGEHPYARPVLGTRASVAALSVASLRAFQARNHGPGRVVIAVAGAVDPEEIATTAEAALAGWRAAPPRPAPTLAAFDRGPANLRVRRPFDTPLVHVAWPGPRLGDPDLAALDVMMSGLADGASSLLTTRLQLEEGIASDAWGSSGARVAGGAIGIGFRPRDGATMTSLAAALEEIRDVRERGLGGRTVDRARQAMLGDLLFADETVDGVAHDLGWYTLTHGDHRAADAYRRALAAVTPSAVRDAAARWLGDDRRVVSVLDRAVGRQPLERVVRRSARVARRQSMAPERTVLANGATLWVLPDGGPVAAIHACMLGGALAEIPRTAGLAFAWSQLVVAGADDMDSSTFAERLDDIAATSVGASGASTLGIQSTFPAWYLDDALELFGATLTSPTFEADEWDRVRDEMVDAIRTLTDRPGELAERALSEALWPGHPWRLPAGGREATLARIGPRSLAAFHARLVRGPNVVVAVSGGVDGAVIKDVLVPWLEELPAEQPDLPPRPAPGPVRAGHQRLVASTEQSHVVAACRGLRATDPRRYALELAAAILNGQGGRLFMALRERRSLAYSVWASARTGWDGGALELGLATAPDRAEEGRLGLLAELHALAEHGPTDAEVDRYRRVLLGFAAMDRQRSSDRAARCAVGERLGLRWSFDDTRRALEAVDASSVQAVVAEAIAQGVATVEVGPRPRARGRGRRP